MSMSLVLIAALLLPPGPGPIQSPAKPAYPKKSGVYAMTPQGPVELKVSGERSDVKMALGLKNYYSADSLDRIPATESVQSFYVSLMDWSPKGVYLVVGREFLINSLDKYQRFSGRVVTRGAVAFEIQSADLDSPGFVLSAIRKLAPAGVPDSDLEVYLVLELRSQSGLNDRAYPIRIQVPKG